MGDRPNFRIIDGDKWNSHVDFEELKKDYLNPDVYVGDILAKHNISRGEYYRLRKRLVEETGIPIKPSNLKGGSPIINVTQYITQDPLTQKYRVAKYVGGILRHYGRYKTLEEAIRVRDVLIEENWDYSFYEEKIKPHYFHARQHEKKDDVLADFKKDYLEGMSIKELMKKYGLSKYHYYQLSTSIKHELGLTRKPIKVRA